MDALMQVRGLPAMTAYMRFGLMGCPCSTSEAFIQSMQNVVCRGGGQRIGTGIPVLTDDRGQSPACGCRLDRKERWLLLPMFERRFWIDHGLDGMTAKAISDLI
ncbi:hypothetical protein [Burkholderia vietnamiensis]|uniref:hypothetical protein n=1 Tax=Burkholderia vietnamiensis TaxID=60552 RepID=UPI0012D9BDFA|nr:hypothetical protein [Burkholderia vietnamiensis]